MNAPPRVLFATTYRLLAALAVALFLGAGCQDPCRGASPPQPCGPAGHACCYTGAGAGTCNAGMTCLSRGAFAHEVCVLCGAAGDPCCNTTTTGCLPNHGCLSGTCWPCGGEGESCCPANRCNGTLRCRPGSGSSRRCRACGGRGEECCDGSACRDGLRCESTAWGSPPTCGGCGADGEPCCLGDTPCTAGLSCGTGVVCAAPVDAGPQSRAGAACTDDASCGSPALHCDTDVGSGFCTGPCAQADTPALEQAMCGGAGSTCLTMRGAGGAGEVSLCTRTCVPLRRLTGCRSGQVCTGTASTGPGSVVDAPGCEPFCADDRHCPPGRRCNARTGECGAAGSDEAMRPDGDPCVLPAEGEPSPCRGLCVGFGDPPGRGICASLINTNVMNTCPDPRPDAAGEATIIPARVGRGDLAYCLFQGCGTDCDCPSGLVCEARGGGTRVCGYDDPAVPDWPCSSAADGGEDASDALVDAAATDTAAD